MRDPLWGFKSSLKVATTAPSTSGLTGAPKSTPVGKGPAWLLPTARWPTLYDRLSTAGRRF
jgi:hypothetical protein